MFKTGPRPTDGFDRRTFLRTCAAGGVAAWATPVILTIDASPAAASPCPLAATPTVLTSSGEAINITSLTNLPDDLSDIFQRHETTLIRLQREAGSTPKPVTPPALTADSLRQALSRPIASPTPSGDAAIDALVAELYSAVTAPAILTTRSQLLAALETGSITDAQLQGLDACVIAIVGWGFLLAGAVTGVVVSCSSSLGNPALCVSAVLVLAGTTVLAAQDLAAKCRCP